MVALHLVAHAHVSQPAFTRRDHYADAWRRLRAGFPDAIACALMPDHVHLLVSPDARPDRVKRRFGKVAAAISLSRGRSLWAPLPCASIVRDRKKLQLDFRYIHLNPCRERLAGDPLEWEWTTHRDLVGAVVDPWIDAGKTARLLGFSSAEALHKFVSNDPSATVGGSPWPAPPGRETVFALTLEDLARAVASAFRHELDALSVRGPLRLVAARVASGFRCFPPQSIQKRFRISPRTYRRLKEAEAPGRVWSAVRLILSDSRLRAAKPGDG